MTNRATLQFVGLFFVFVLAFSLLFQSSWVDKKVILPYTEFIATLSSGILDFLDIPAEARGTLIRHDRFAVDIRRGCDGVVATFSLLPPAWPIPWPGRTEFWVHCWVCFDFRRKPDTHRHLIRSGLERIRADL